MHITTHHHLMPLGLLLHLLHLPSLTSAAARSSKRGLIFIPKEETPEDNGVWVQKGSDLTWYYNYLDVPSPAFAGIDQSKFEFVPMMWGVDANDAENDDFLQKVKALIDEQEIAVKHALAFNEPDERFDYGGSSVTPQNAAKAWVKNFEPLRAMGVEVGLPAVTGSQRGIDWIKDFLDECKGILDADCEFDFVPVHFYGPFPAMASHIGQRLEAFPEKPVWVTEYGFPHQNLQSTQEFYNDSSTHFDDNNQIDRYSYFGSFRSHTSNVGPNVTFLNNDGELTDIGSWYLGGSGTGIDPMSGSHARGLRAPLGVAFAALLVSFLLI